MPAPPDPSLAERLNRLLARSGLTVWEAAGRARMEAKQAWELFNGKNDNPKVNTLARLVRAMGFTLADLYADEPPEKSGEGG